MLEATHAEHLDRAPIFQKHHDLTEVIFLVEEAPEGGYTARALGASIFAEADTLPELHA